MAAQEEPLLADVHKFQVKNNDATPAFETVAFITGLDITRSTAAREISSFNDCGETVERPGRSSRSISGTFYIYNGSAEGLNHVFVEELFDNKSEFEFQIIPLDCDGNELIGEYARSGTGFLTELGDSHQLGESSVATFTINVKGKLTIAELV